MAATNQQVQNFVDTRVRVHSELARQLALSLADDRATIDDVYNAVNAGSPTWTDTRTDGPPHLLTPADVLAFNAFAEDVKNFIVGHGSYAVILKSCVRPV